MSEIKPISQMMSELEDESREIVRERIDAKSQEVIENLQDQAVSNAIKIRSLVKLGKARGEIDTEDEADALRKLERYMKDLSISDEKMDYFDAINYSIDKSYVGNKILFGDDFNVLQAVLEDKVILPTLRQCEKVDKRGYGNLLIIPPVYFQDIPKYLPEGVNINADEVFNSARAGDVFNRKRPRQFYAIATNPLPWNGQAQRAREYKVMSALNVRQALAEEIEKPENKDLHLRGLTIAEFIMINLYEATKLLKENERSDLKDEFPINHSAIYFLGDTLGAQDVIVGRASGRTDSWNLSIFEKSIGSTGSFPPLAAHFKDYNG